MQKISFYKYIFTLLAFICIRLCGEAQNYSVIDINKSKNSFPYNYQFSSKNMFAELKGIFYFGADDGTHGTELYASDGTAAGTHLVKDLIPGTASSYPFDIITSGDKIFFIASSNYNYSQLWVSDGTDTGTRVLNILPEALYFSYLQQLSNVGGTLFFVYNFLDLNGVFHCQLWKSDGSEAGTTMLSDINGFMQQLVSVGNRLFFVAYNYSSYLGAELYTSDGTVEGTKVVSDINPNFNTGSNPSHLTSFKGSLYFDADDGTGYKLWVSNSKAEGAHPVRNIHNVYLAPGDMFQVDPFATKDNTLYFQGYLFDSATLSSTGNELCKFNTSSSKNTVALVKNIIPGVKSSYPSFITNVRGTLYFTIGPDSADAQLWKSDGTKAGTVPVKTINPGGINNYNNLSDFNGTLLFAFGDNAFGTELWKSDGTDSGTVLIKDIQPGIFGSNPVNFTTGNGIVLFTANGPTGGELWRTNGTAEGTKVIDINNKATSSSSPYGITAFKDGKAILSASNGILPGNLYLTDGSEAGTQPIDSFFDVRILNPVPQFVVLKGSAYFFNNNNRLCKTDGTGNGSVILPIPLLFNPQSGYIANFVASDSLIYIVINNFLSGQSLLWRSDGTEEGTFILKYDLSYAYNSYPTILANTLYFTAFDANTGFTGLWKTDGSVAGTKIVKNTGTYNPLMYLYVFKGKLFFSAYTPTNFYGPPLWISDGTEAGTKVLIDVAISNGPFAQANGKLFFYALDRISKGYELYATDGTVGGTKLVKDINPNTGSSLVSSLIGGDSLVYFTADDGTHGMELWKSNGTNAGTKLVKDITPGINGIYLSSFNMVSAHDKLFFILRDTLWQSDGTPVNTHPVTDKVIKGIHQINGLTVIGENLYFSAYRYATGQELYVANVAPNKPPSVTITNPANGENFLSPATIDFQASARDTDGMIVQVDFYAGSTLLTSEHLLPYTCQWQNVPAGTYAVTAVAKDNWGATAKSAPVTITVGNTPLLSRMQAAVTGKETPDVPATVQLAPNPAHSFLNIYMGGMVKNKPQRVSIISVAGVVMKSLQLSRSLEKISVDVSALASGIYIAKIACGDKIFYREFIKK